MAKVKSGAESPSSSASAEMPALAEVSAPAFLPFDAKFSPAPRREFHETIVFLHQFGGNADSVLRHVKMVNDLGFDAVRFTLMFSQVNPTKHLPITANLKFGIRHVWTEQTEAVLNSLPGKKILYSFSMSSNSGLMALAHRRAKDVVGWICDGGPFLQLPVCIWNLYEHHYSIKSRLFRGALTGGSLLFYGLGFEGEVPSLMRALPKSFPILSIRGLQDPLVAPEAIDEVLALRKDIELETVSFDDGHHLDGLKRFRAAYQERAERFLRRVATRVDPLKASSPR